jgi:3-isopropylmalate/(R)-2-methylmalate dehydratase small subunit
MKIAGRVWKFGSNVDTDAIIPARYLNQSDPRELAKHVMEEEKPDFLREVKKGDILLADRNFGCGSSREHAPLALKAAGVSCIIARTFARIFYRNSLNLGLPLLESPEASGGIKDGDRVQVNLSTGEIFDLTQNRKFHAKPIPTFMQTLIRDGGLIFHLRKEKSKRK